MIVPRTLALLAFFSLVSLAAHADPISAGAVASTSIGPSADSVSFSAANEGGSTFIQQGIFDVGDSGQLQGTFAFNFLDDVTVGGVTQAIEVFGQDDVTLCYDTLSIFASAPVQVGGSTWALRGFDMTGYDIQPYDISLTADIAPAFLPGALPAATPEPAGLVLLGTGALATAFTIRRRQVFAA